MTPPIVCLGLAHQTAPLAVRERIAPDRDQVKAMLRRWGDLAREVAILSTCGRFEVYLVGGRSTIDRCREHLARLTALPLDLLQTHTRARQGDQAVLHLLRVGAGLESQLLGEDHVLGQVRRAFALAAERGTVGPILSALFRAAIHTGKRVRHETDLNRTARSFAKIAAAHAVDALGSLASRNVVILGSGQLARSVVAHLACRPPGRLLILSRHLQRAAEIARPVGGAAAEINLLSDSLRQADVAIACTSAPRFLLDPRTVHPRQKPLFIIDLGVPRNVDPAVAVVEGVTLHHLDQLPGDDGPTSEIIQAAAEIVQQEFSRFSRWLEGRRAARISARLARRDEGLDPRAVKRRLPIPIPVLEEATAA